jgi:hypothetical protein
VLRDGTGQGGRFVRLLLLAGTLFGLATMHTLGHAGMQTHHDHHIAEIAAAASGPAHELAVMHEVAEPSSAGVCDGGCAHAPGPSPHGGMTGWSICVAVLGAFAMIFLVAMVVARSRRRRPPEPGTDRWAVVSRGPPVRPVGLAMAAVSVLRI